MVHFISGKPGGGKSFYALKLLLDELRFGSRHIVTNLALKIGELNAYYHAHFADDSGDKRYQIPWFIPRFLANYLFWYLPEALALKVFPLSPEAAESRMLSPQLDDISSRITLITDDELPTFFTRRSHCEIESIPNTEWKKGRRPDYSGVKDGGIFFCLDEIHIAFNSRAWADTGAEVLYYLSQHRKLGDDVICITQSVANVDKQFRSVAQDFTYLRNLAKERFGHFRLPARFIRKTYAQPPVGDKSQPMELGSFSLDVNGLAKCYDTAKGVGIHGRSGADTKERKTGIHWAWFVIGLPVLLYLILHFLPLFIAKHFSPRPVHSVQSPVFVPEIYVSRSSTTNGSVPFSMQANAAAGVEQVRTNDEITCVGYCHVGNSWLVFLSDGGQFDSAYGEVDYVHRREVSCFGKKYRISIGQAFSEVEPIEQPETEFPRSPARPVNRIQVIPFGVRRQFAPLPSAGFQSQTLDERMGQTENDGFSR